MDSPWNQWHLEIVLATCFLRDPPSPDLSAFNARMSAMQTKMLPPELQGIFFDFYWETTKSWRLPTPVTVVPFGDLAWHLDLPVWSTVRGQMRFDLAPSSVLRDAVLYPLHWKRIIDAEIQYPMEMFRNGGRWVILDGYHRLARHYLKKNRHVPVRRHPEHFKPRILCFQNQANQRTSSN